MQCLPFTALQKFMTRCIEFSSFPRESFSKMLENRLVQRISGFIDPILRCDGITGKVFLICLQQNCFETVYKTGNALSLQRKYSLKFQKETLFVMSPTFLM